MSTSVESPAQQDATMRQAIEVVLHSFHIPLPPPSNQEGPAIDALTLVGDIRMSEYADLLVPQANDPNARSYTIPDLPQTIETVTLLRFPLGYPVGFLTNLSSKLPNLRILILEQQCFAGNGPETAKDADNFFRVAKSLRSLYMTEVYVMPGFISAVARHLAGNEKGLAILNVDYIFRPTEENFTKSLPVLELPALINPSMVFCNLSMAPALEASEEARVTEVGDQSTKEGIMVVHDKATAVLVRALTEQKTAPEELKLLDTTLYALSVEDLEAITNKHQGLVILHVILDVKQVDGFLDRVWSALESLRQIEQLEFVLSPSWPGYEESPEQLEKLTNLLPDASRLTSLVCPNLSRVEVTVRRAPSLPSALWTKEEDGEWKGGFTMRRTTVSEPSATTSS